MAIIPDHKGQTASTGPKDLKAHAGAQTRHATQRCRGACRWRGQRGAETGPATFRHPASVERLAVLSILPTFAMWKRLSDVEKAINTYHWFWLAQKPPVPHDLLLGAPRKHVRNTIRSWTKSQSLDAFTDQELTAYGDAFSRPEVIAAVCAEYRAGWTTDRKHDEADLAAHKKITDPVLVMWGLVEYSEAEMLAAWHHLAPDIESQPIDCGHFVTEEAPHITGAALINFFAKSAPT
jgi:haloacetate dehalogenase